MGAVLYVIFSLIPLAAWVTHVVTCISDEKWILLLIGALGFPVGIVHGIGIWLGFF